MQWWVLLKSSPCNTGFFVGNNNDSLILKVKALMQKTHPDKTEGFEDEFIRMKQCSDWIKSGIPLPTPTHTSGECVANTRLINA